MSVVSVEARSFILALFIRDDGERFLLGDNGYDFIDSQLHFTANAIENDEVQKQGTDGVLVAGQVRRASVQTFDGYIGDATTPKSKIEQMRRDFFAFFAKGHHFRVIYVDCNRDAWQRKGGYLVDAPEVKELWQIHPEYHVGLNFEDVNYYEYDENAEGEEILANVLSVPISSEIEGGLEWDEDGAISVLPYGNSKTATGNPISIADAVEAPLKSLEIQGNTEQDGTPTPSSPVAVKVVTGENTIKITGKNLLKLPSAGTSGGITYSVNSDGTFNVHGTNNSGYEILFSLYLDSSEFQSVNYTLGSREALPYGLGCRCEIYRGGTWKRSFVSVNYTRQTQTGTPDFTDANRVRVAITVANGATVNIDNVGIQLEKGSSPTTFEPYQEQSYEVNLGKNLFDKENSSSVTHYFASSSSFANNSSAIAILLPAAAGQTYTVSSTNRSIVDSQANIAFTDKIITSAGESWLSKTTWSSSSDSASVTAPSGAKYMYIYVKWSSDATAIANTLATIQVELGSTATSYAAYFTPIELCKIGTYQDYIYKDGGKWYVHKEIGKSIIDSSYYSTRYGTNSYGLTQFLVNISFEEYFDSANVANMLSNSFVKQSTSFADTQTQGFLPALDPSLHRLRAWTRISTTTADTEAQFKTWLDDNRPIFYYKLDTATDTEITNEALIAQLDAILAGGTQAGANNIMLTPSAGATGTLEVEYYSEYQDGGYVWEEGGSGGPTTVVNESISAVYPVWTVYGPAQNPILENTTNNTSIEYVGMVADGQTLVIDMGAQTASLDGLNVLSALTGDFIQLEAGSNILLYSASNDAPASEIGWSEIVG